jgi:hypothetical protein
MAEHSITRHRQTIHLADDSELARLLAQVDETSVRVDLNGVGYRVTRDDDPWAGYDPSAVRVAIKASAGMLSRDEGEALKAYIERAREEGSDGTALAGVVPLMPS